MSVVLESYVPPSLGWCMAATISPGLVSPSIHKPPQCASFPFALLDHVTAVTQPTFMSF